jgi:N-acetyl-anhydromuramyl-L-alanine amidase AmpD
MNDIALGICVVGNFDLAEPTHQQYFMLSALCRELMRRFDIPRHGISPHWAFADKTCPGRRFDMLKLRDYCSGSTQEAKA